MSAPAAVYRFTDADHLLELMREALYRYANGQRELAEAEAKYVGERAHRQELYALQYQFRTTGTFKKIVDDLQLARDEVKMYAAAVSATVAAS